jgi:transcription-repair coupling factor (superfamily II helicase)
MSLIQALNFSSDAFAQLMANSKAEIRVSAPKSSWSAISAHLAMKEKLVLITSSSRKAEEIYRELISYRGQESGIYLFPAWEPLPFEKLSPRADTVSKRARTIEAIKNGKAEIVVMPIRSAISPIAKDFINHPHLTLTANIEISISEISKYLNEVGYERVDLVETRGQYALRGGLIDIYLGNLDYPIRIDFFGDEIEEIYGFSVADQRRSSLITEPLTIYPVHEIFLTPTVKEKAAQLAITNQELSTLFEKISNGIMVEGIESIGSLLLEEFSYPVELFNQGEKIIYLDVDRINSRALDFQSTNREFLEATWSNLAWSTEQLADSAKPLNIIDKLRKIEFDTLAQLKDRFASNGNPAISVAPYAGDFESEIDFEIQDNPIHKQGLPAFIPAIRDELKAGYLLFVTASGKGTLNRFGELLKEAELPYRILNSVPTSLTRDAIYLLAAELENGFLDETNKVRLITEKDLSATRVGSKDGDRMPSRRKKSIDPLELKKGDYVVHEQHGVGRFLELVERTVGGISREYLVIEYAASKRGQPGDRLYLPTDNLDQLTKYIGGEKPALHKIGGSEWSATKKKARKAVKQIAAELIQLYAARMSAPGYAFGPDTTWQKELEDAFPYIETADQLSTIEEVKADMEKPQPMDRIICGDVGYGKTEIAIRAAFKAVQDGKQVALLVPTTLLVSQHLATFTNRYEGFPVRVRGLSRFNTDKESKEIIEGLKAGTIDIVIGTHRLLSKDVQFKDLGLIIIDEEQRFGVEHKEELKKARTNIDVLSMSATPIPRTLEMAITGIREMSNITTPPEERHPILTYVGPYDEKQITAAIHRELLREGQVFFLHNRVESIDTVALKIKELVPEARVRVAHGQMSEKLLEEVIEGFWNKEFDVLVSTTIIESGIDIPNANTLIVDRADIFGLSQLHQIRGRVGRSRERAYAYFLYPADKPLGEVAHDRLTTIATHSDLGSGAYVALKDLEIRGAGNLLGQEQSGHIADVGFDLYMRMVGEAVAEFKTGIVDVVDEVVTDCKIEIPVTAHLPTNYVDSERLRLDIYRRIADSKDKSTLQEIENELRDRFGEMPNEAKNLFEVANIKLNAKTLGLTEVVAQGKFLRLQPVNLPESMAIRLKRVYPGSLYKESVNTLLIARPEKAAWEIEENLESTQESSDYLRWLEGVFENLFPNR